MRCVGAFFALRATLPVGHSLWVLSVRRTVAQSNLASIPPFQFTALLPVAASREMINIVFSVEMRVTVIALFYIYVYSSTFGCACSFQHIPFPPLKIFLRFQHGIPFQSSHISQRPQDQTNLRIPHDFHTESMIKYIRSFAYP